MNYPRIRFRDSQLILSTLDQDLRPVYKENGWEHLLEHDFIAGKLQLFEKQWRPHETEVLHGICEVFELEFSQNIIDIFIAPLRRSFSLPMFIATNTPEDHVVNIISHELIHRLTSDNTLLGDTIIDKKDEIYRRIFKDDKSFETHEHIIVHAGLKYLYLEVFKDPSQLQWDLEFSKSKPYVDAWKYVQNHDYRQIIDQFHQECASYVRLNKE